eukprot:UN05343
MMPSLLLSVWVFLVIRKLWRILIKLHLQLWVDFCICFWKWELLLLCLTLYLQNVYTKYGLNVVHLLYLVT